MPKLGARPFRQSFNLARRLAISNEALNSLGVPPKNGTPWGVMYENAVKDMGDPWLGMLGNGPDKDNPPGYPDGVGNCVLDDDLRNIAFWTALGSGTKIRPTTKDAYDLYSKVAGFNASDPNTDTGTEPHDNAKYMTATGWTDSHGVVHKLAGWMPIDPLNDNHVKWAIQMFGCVKWCMNFPGFASAQFDKGTWDYTGQPYSIEGGHDVMGTQYEQIPGHDMYDIVSWNKRISMTHRFKVKFMDMCVAPVSIDFIRQNGTSPSGFNLDQMLANLKAVGSATL